MQQQQQKKHAPENAPLLFINRNLFMITNKRRGANSSNQDEPISP